MKFCNIIVMNYDGAIESYNEFYDFSYLFKQPFTSISLKMIEMRNPNNLPVTLVLKKAFIINSTYVIYMTLVQYLQFYESRQRTTLQLEILRNRRLNVIHRFLTARLNLLWWCLKVITIPIMHYLFFV